MPLLKVLGKIHKFFDRTTAKMLLHIILLCFFLQLKLGVTQLKLPFYVCICTFLHTLIC